MLVGLLARTETRPYGATPNRLSRAMVGQVATLKPAVMAFAGAGRVWRGAVLAAALEAAERSQNAAQPVQGLDWPRFLPLFF